MFVFVSVSLFHFSVTCQASVHVPSYSFESLRTDLLSLFEEHTTTLLATTTRVTAMEETEGNFHLLSVCVLLWVA